MKAIIVAGGSFLQRELFLRLYERNEFLICADGGLNYIDSIEIMPDLIVGDLDSVNPEILGKYKNVELQRFKPEKDYTDTELAIEKAVELGYSDIVLLCATGTRIDHTLANMMLIYKYMERGINLIIIDNNNYIKVISKEETIKKDNYKYLSLIPITESIFVERLTGFKYPLVNTVVERGSTLCISNEIVENQGIVKIKSGISFLIKSND